MPNETSPRSVSTVKKLEISAFDLAQRFVGTKEVPGTSSSPQVLAMLRLDENWPNGDHVPWCSAFVNYVAWLLRLPRSKSLLARSWLGVGTPVACEEARVGFDVVILKRGEGDQPDAENTTAPGHVGFFAGVQQDRVLLLGGNQQDSVSVASYPLNRLLGVRRLYGE
jgi:uncharacterized protein (TIGR02594 family)